MPELMQKIPPKYQGYFSFCLTDKELDDYASGLLRCKHPRYYKLLREHVKSCIDCSELIKIINEEKKYPKIEYPVSIFDGDSI